MGKRLHYLAVLGLASLLASSAGASPSFKIVAHPSVAAEQLTREELSRVFLKKTTSWKGGSTAVPVDQEPSSPVRAAFSETVHGRTVTAVKSYWQSLIFSGRGVPPAEQRSDDDVLAFVRSTPGAVGYVSPGAATSGVKELSLADGAGEGPAAPGPRFLDAEFVRKNRLAGKEPAYPPSAMRHEEEGVVVAKIVIAPDGHISDVAIQQTHPAFEPAVREALAGWKFKSDLANGVAAYTIVRFNFRLQQQ